MIFSSFTVDTASKAKIMDNFQHNLIGTTTDYLFQMIFKEKLLSEF
jgi:hypothetical protein